MGGVVFEKVEVHKFDFSICKKCDSLYFLNFFSPLN